MGKKLKIILSYGALLSLPMILMSVLAYVFDMSQNKAFGWVSILVFVVTIVLIQILYRNNFYEGFINYGKLLGGTLLMLLFASAIMYIYTFLFYKFIAPEEIDKFLEIARAELYENDQLSSAQINKSYEVMTKYVFTPLSMSIRALFSTLGLGFIFSLITSIFIKKKQDGFTEAMKNIEDVDSIREIEESEIKE